MALRKVKKVLQIDSADRDTTKYPTNGDYIVYLPRIYKNVTSIRLMGAEFPSIMSSGIIGQTTNNSFKTITSLPYTGTTLPSPTSYVSFVAPNVASGETVLIGLKNSTVNGSYYFKFTSSGYTTVSTMPTVESFAIPYIQQLAIHPINGKLYYINGAGLSGSNNVLSTTGNGDTSTSFSPGLGYINGLTFDSYGNYYFTTGAPNACRAYMYYVGTSGNPNNIAANLVPLYSSNNTPITTPTANTLYIIAGIPATNAYTGDGGNAYDAVFGYIYRIILDSDRNVYISDNSQGNVRMVYNKGITVPAYYGTSMTCTGINGNIITGTSPLTVGQLVYTAGASGGLTANTSYIVLTAGTFNANDFTLALVTDALTTITPNSAPTIYIPTLVTPIRGNIYTVVGSASSNTGTTPIGNGTIGPNTTLNYVFGIYVDSSKNLYFADSGNNRIRKVTQSTGAVSTIVGTGGIGGNDDGRIPTLAKLNVPTDITMDANNNIYIAESTGNRVRMVYNSGITVSGNSTSGTIPSTSMTQGYIYTIAGTYEIPGGVLGDGSIATSAHLKSPSTIAVDSTGSVYISDNYGNNGMIRMIPSVSGWVTGQSNIYTLIYDSRLPSYPYTPPVTSSNFTVKDGDIFGIYQSGRNLVFLQNGVVKSSTVNFIVPSTFYAELTTGTGTYTPINFLTSTTPVPVNTYYFLTELEGLNKSDETRVGGDKSAFIDKYFAKIPVVTNASGKIAYSDKNLAENIAKYSPPIGALDRLHIRTRLHSQQDNSGFIFSVVNHDMTFEIEYIDNVANMEEK